MDIIWLFFMLSALQPIIKQKLLEASRKRMIGRAGSEIAGRPSRAPAGNDEPAWLSDIPLHRH